jgi:hypothetical protein
VSRAFVPTACATHAALPPAGGCRALRILLVLLMLAPLGPPGAAAQEVKNAAIGGAAGFMGGIAMTVSIVVARARLQGQYLDSPSDLIHWQTTPMIAGPAAGVFFGLTGEDVLRGSIIGSTSGMLIGAAAGAGLGWLISGEPESPWAGGVMGGGLGLALGGLTGAFLGWKEQDDDAADPGPPATITIRVPL